MTVARAIYRLGIRAFGAAIRLAGLFNPKAKAWVEDRVGLWDKVNSLSPAPAQGRVWCHCASLGEFEMARPVIEALQAQKPGISVVVTFFSPSGYRVRKDFPGCEAVLCLPLDTPSNALRFVKSINPTLAIWVKYDLWWEHLETLHRHNVPIHLICAQFRRDQALFRWPRWYGKPLLSNFKHIYSIDAQSCPLLGAIGVTHCSVAGDTRYDRVAELAKTAQPVEGLAEWAHGHQLVVCGSTWPKDEAVLAVAVNRTGDDVRWLIVPHETHAEAVNGARARFQGSITYTQLLQGKEARVVVMDRIGLLGRAYQYATVAYVGGAFGSGLHNILEATAYGLPVVFGPKTNRFPDAAEMARQGLAFSVSNPDQTATVLGQLLRKDEGHLKLGVIEFMIGRTGATGLICQHIAFTDPGLLVKIERPHS